jgi:hypothetical protein
MDETEQRIEMGKLLGHTNIHWLDMQNVRFQGDTSRIGLWSDQGWVPNFHEDLNAIASAEATLSDHERRKHGEILQELVGVAVVGYVPDYERNLKELSRIACASKTDRIEALLKAKGAWSCK